MRIKNFNIDEIIGFVEKYYYIFLVMIIALISFNAFYKLVETPIIHFDEARHGISAYEMLKSNEFIVNTYGYKNDYWNLKPPLSFWFIIMGYKLLGFNVLGLRLYSSLSAILTVLSIMIFVVYKHGKFESIISGIILATSTPYIMNHGARSADADSLFVLLFTVSMISMLLINKKSAFLYIAALSAALAFLTKSWHGINIVIIGALYIFASEIFVKLKFKQWILFILSYVFPILIWSVLRIKKDGFAFFKGMIEYDLLQRSANAIEGHTGGWWYYINEIIINYEY